jgi:hypothetical protein
MREPEGVAVDTAGDRYVADWGNFRVVKLAAPELTEVDPRCYRA